MFYNLIKDLSVPDSCADLVFNRLLGAGGTVCATEIRLGAVFLAAGHS